MTQTTHPTKESIREYLERRTHEVEPPPSAEEIRRQLGWELIPENRRPGQIAVDMRVDVCGFDRDCYGTTEIVLRGAVRPDDGAA